MPTYRLRAWCEQTLYDHEDYLIEAESLEAAALQLKDVVESATLCGETSRHDTISTIDEELHLIEPLDPEIVVADRYGVALLDQGDNRIRDLIQVPSGEDQLGELLVTEDENEQ